MSLFSPVKNTVIFKCNNVYMKCTVHSEKEVDCLFIRKKGGKSKVKTITISEVWNQISFWSGWHIAEGKGIIDMYPNIQMGTRLSKLRRCISLISFRERAEGRCEICSSIVKIKQSRVMIFEFDGTKVKKRVCPECQKTMYKHFFYDN